MERILLFVSPALAGLAGWIVELAAKYLPGHPTLSSSELTAIFVTGAAWAMTHLLLLLHRNHTARLAAAQRTHEIHLKG